MNLFNQIARYIKKKMSSDEYNAFEEELRQNPELKTEVSKHIIEHRLIESALEEKIRKKVMLTYEETSTNTAAQSTYLKAAVYAVVLAGMTLATILYFKGKTSQSTPIEATQIALQAYKEAPITMTNNFRNGSNANTHDSIMEIQNLNSSRLASLQQNELLKLAAEADRSSVDDPQKYYLAGHIYFLAGQYETASDRFRQYIYTMDIQSELRPFAQYFYGLSALAARRPDDEVQQVFHSITADSSHRFFTPALEIEKQLFSHERQ
jgi:tetratricopeptide (TPR) repeat protein